MFPHERSLVKDYANRPFSIIGVNSDRNLEDLKAKNAKENITWRSFWCGEKGTRGDIPTAWNVRGWPTIYLIDHEGVIRYKNVRGEALDKAIAELVAKAEAAQKN
jgi:thioredoxin family protein